MSPLTVPITIVPTGLAPVSANSGLRIAIPPFIELADSSTSGTNKIPSRKSIPTMVMPSTNALPRTCSGVQPRLNRICVPSSISSFSPSYKSSCICNTRSSSDRSAKIISSCSDIQCPSQNSDKLNNHDQQTTLYAAP